MDREMFLKKLDELTKEAKQSDDEAVRFSHYGLLCLQAAILAGPRIFYPFIRSVIALMIDKNKVVSLIDYKNGIKPRKK